jgi:hypothetical protein
MEREKEREREGREGANADGVGGWQDLRGGCAGGSGESERDFFGDSLLVLIHSISVMIR